MSRTPEQKKAVTFRLDSKLIPPDGRNNPYIRNDEAGLFHEAVSEKIKRTNEARHKHGQRVQKAKKNHY